jgi:F-type H+-transporting ATPase subunit epsilon
VRLSILLPYRVFLEADGLSRIVARTSIGSLGILPRRLDFAVSLVPGILEYSGPDGDVFVAVDEGLLVKSGDEVIAAVHDAAGGADPGLLRKTIEDVFRSREEEQRAFREAMVRFEGEFVRRFLESSRG